MPTKSYQTHLRIIVFTILILFTFVYTNAESVKYIHTDHLGSTSIVTNENGSVVSNSTYYPYGNTNNILGINPSERDYTGQISDQGQTGLYYYNARYYNPTISKFTQADTVNDQQNRYAYVDNNPINKIDPSGHKKKTGGGGGGREVPKDDVDWEKYLGIFEGSYGGEKFSLIIQPENDPMVTQSVMYRMQNVPNWYNILSNWGFVKQIFYIIDTLTGGTQGYVTTDIYNDPNYLDLKARIFNDVDFDSGSKLKFLELFALSFRENTEYDRQTREVYERAWSEGREPEDSEFERTFFEGNLVSRVVEDRGVCRHFAGLANVMLAEVGIESQILESNQMSHAFLEVLVDGIPYIVDPTWGQVWSKSEHSETYDVTDYQIAGSYVTSSYSRCTTGACH